jgi:hypothetical protein
VLGLAALVLAFQAGRESTGTTRRSSSPVNPPWDATTPSAPSRAHAVDAATAATMPAGSDASDTATPLPPYDTPLAQVLEELETRARRGDRRAACRLALDGNFCRTHRPDVETLDYFERSIASKPRVSEADIAFLAEIEARQQRSRRMCPGLPEGWAEENSWRWMLQAAQAGDTRLAAYYAASPPMRRGYFLERPEPWQQYRLQAPRLLLAAAQRGEVEAIWLLQRLHRRGQFLEGMPNAIPQDYRRAVIYMLALQPIAQGESLEELRDQSEVLRGEFDSATWATIQHEAAEFSRRHFSGIVPRDFQAGVFRDLDARHCE